MTDETKTDSTETEAEVLRISEENKAVVEELAKIGVQVGNVLGTRHEEFIGYLVELGIVTREQLAIFNLRWEKKYQEQLTEGRTQILQQIRMQQLLSKNPKPAPSGLIVPPH